MQDTNTRYQMRTENLLPKFISPKNPFAQPPKPASPAVSSVASAKLATGSLFDSTSRPAAPVVAAESKPRPARSVKVETKPVPAPVPAPAAVPLSPLPAAKKSNRFDWLSKLNPLALMPSFGGSAANSSRSRSGRRPVQAELSLDKVRVVRNDLSSADIEIVPGKLMGMPSGASPVLSAAERVETGAWGRLASRFLGAEQTQIHQ